jgi:hypothetical protein
MFLTTALASIAVGMTGCFVEVLDDDDGGEYELSKPRYSLPSEANPSAELCSEGEHQHPRYSKKEYAACFKEEDYKWRVSCKSADCQSVPVFVHYMLTEDLGAANTVTVEAFDNNKYIGAPVSTVQINHFSAKNRGDYQQTEIYLAPGTYFLRAFIANESEMLVPYTYQGMELVSEKPLGVYGALSSPASVAVAPKKMQAFSQPVHITLDKLFKNKQEEPDTKAYLRLNLSIAPESSIPQNRKVLVQLREELDLGLAPTHEFAMLTESFMIEGRQGQAEFLSSSLPIGNYFVFAFVDANGNELYDEGELAALAMRNGEASKVAIKLNRMETLQLTLKLNPELPEAVL